MGPVADRIAYSSCLFYRFLVVSLSCILSVYFCPFLYFYSIFTPRLYEVCSPTCQSRRYYFLFFSISYAVPSAHVQWGQDRTNTVWKEMLERVFACSIPNRSASSSSARLSWRWKQKKGKSIIPKVQLEGNKLRSPAAFNLSPLPGANSQSA